MNLRPTDRAASRVCACLAFDPQPDPAAPLSFTRALFGAGALWLVPVLHRRRAVTRAALLAVLGVLGTTATLPALAASDHWVQAWVDARGNGVTSQQDTGPIDGPVASAGPLGFHVANAFGSYDSDISASAAYGHLWGQASAAQNSPNFARQSDANADLVVFQDRLTLVSSTLSAGTFVSFTATMVLTDKLSAGPTTCCSNVAVNGHYDFSGFAVGDQAGPGQSIDRQLNPIVQTMQLNWAIGAPHDIGAELFFDVGSSPGVNSATGSSRVDLADVSFFVTLPAGVTVAAASGTDYTLPVPEPATQALMALGVAGLYSARRLRALRWNGQRQR